MRSSQKVIEKYQEYDFSQVDEANREVINYVLYGKTGKQSRFFLYYLLILELYRFYLFLYCCDVTANQYQDGRHETYLKTRSFL